MGLCHGSGSSYSTTVATHGFWLAPRYVGRLAAAVHVSSPQKVQKALARLAEKKARQGVTLSLAPQAVSASAPKAVSAAMPPSA
jgi:hypothetical protein